MRIRKILLCAALLLLSSFDLFSQIYMEGSGSLVFASKKIEGDIPDLSGGTAFSAGIGIQKNQWLFGLEFSRNFWNSDDENVRDYKENYFLYKIRRQFLFSQIALTPGLSLGANYPQSSISDFGDIRSFIARASLDVDFIPQEKSPLVLFLGMGYNLEHQDGTFAFLDSHVGVRIYPFCKPAVNPRSKGVLAQEEDSTENAAAKKQDKVLETRILDGVLEVKTIKAGSEWIVTGTKPFHFEDGLAVYSSLPQELIDENSLFLNVFSAFLIKLGDYRVTIERYENNTSSTAEENINVLLPLSQIRAEAMLERLSIHGIKRKSMAATGKGGTGPQQSHFEFRVIKIK